MFKSFCAGMIAILFSTTLGVFAATQGINSSVPAHVTDMTIASQSVD